MVLLYRLWILIWINAVHSENTGQCKVKPLLIDKVTKVNELYSDVSEFFHQQNLQSGHETLRKVLKEMGTSMIIEDKMPLLAYLIKYRKLLDDKLHKTLDALESHISKKCDDFENSLQDSEVRQSVELNHVMRDFKQFIQTKRLECKNRKPPPSRTDLDPNLPYDCWDILGTGDKRTGVHTIFPQGRKKPGIAGYCDMDTAGGGWTVFLIRKKQANQEDFSRNWRDYKNGFGSPPNEFWMGLEALHLITTSKKYEVRIDAEGPGKPALNWGEYSNFRVDGEDTKYQLTLKGYNSQSTMENNGFARNNGYRFTTIDSDNDNHGNNNCAASEGGGGGFWYRYCSFHFPTRPSGDITLNGWSKTDTKIRSADSLQMKVRPQH